MDLSETPQASPLGRNSSRGDVDQYHLNDLKNQIKLHEKTIKKLEKEINVQKSQLEVKDEVIGKAEGTVKILEENALASETEIKSLRKNKKKWDEERKRLLAQMDAANDEADRLNQLMIEYAGNNSEVMNGSMEDTVRLHNQLSQARKEIQNLRGEIKSLENLIKAKDDALELHASEFAKVEETMASKKADQNTIADLKRQVEELKLELGGEHRYGKMADSEIDSIRAALADKETELEAAMEKLDSQREQIQDAKRVKAKADELMAAASEKMAQAVAMMERTVAAESERMKSGGFVQKDVHTAEILAVSSQIDEYKSTIESMKEENMQAKLLLKRIVGAVDGGIEQALSRDDVTEKFGNGVIAIQELRKEIKSLEDIIVSKEGTILSLRASKAASDARAQKSIVASLHAKRHLADSLSEFDYTVLMNEPPPTEDDIIAAEKQLEVNEDMEDSVSYGVLYKEQLRLQEENNTLSKTIQEFDAKMDLAQQEAKRAISIAVMQSSEEIEHHKSECSKKEEEILQIKSAMDEQSIALESVREENQRVQEEMTEQKRKEIEDIQSNHSSVIAAMEQRHESLIAEMEAVKSSKEEDALKQISAQTVNPIQLNIEIKELQQNATNSNDDSMIFNEQESISPDVEEQVEEDPVTPRQSKVFESPLDKSPKKQFTGRDDVGMVSPEALSQILDSLIESKKSRKDFEGDELYREAIEMLQGELSKLSLEMASDNEIASKLRGELGDLKTAQLSAKTTAELLESYNAMSMKLAAHKSMAAQRENVFARHEQQLMNEISDLRMEIRRLKGKSALKSVKKAFSSTMRGIKKSLDTTPKNTSVDSASPLGDTLPSLEK